MEIDLSKQYNYKIREKETGNYWTGNRSKATWHRPSAILDILKGNVGYFPIKQPEKYEIVLIPLDNPLAIDAVAFTEFYKQAEIDKNTKKLKKEQKRQDAKAEAQKVKELNLLKSLKQKYPDA